MNSAYFFLLRLRMFIVLCLVPMDISQEEYEKIRAVKCNPVSDLCITDEGVFTADVHFYDNGGVQIIGTLKDNILLAGNPSADADAWPGMINRETTYRNYFVGLMSAAEAAGFKDKFPDMAEDANPVVIFFKYKLK